MSESDDTDELLLVPPDLFVIDSEFEEPYITAPYYKIVDTLITQVSQLEDRVNNYITIGSVTTLDSTSNDYIDDYHLFEEMSQERNTYGDNTVASTQSTPQKPRTIFKLNSLPPSPNQPRQTSPNSRTFLSPSRRRYTNNNNGRSPSHNHQRGPKPEDVNVDNSQSEKMKLLNEIDHFITNVKTKTSTAARNLDQEFKANDRGPLEMKDVNAFLDDMETQLMGDAENVNMLTATSASDVNSSTAQSIYSVEALDSLSSGSSQITAYHNANPNSQEIRLREDRQETTESRRFVNGLDAKRSTRSTNRLQSDNNDADRRLLSLTDLWGQYNANGSKNIMSKLEEERLRRKHCEDLIHELQQKILELQERLAVAIDVDQSKDAAILRFHDAWNKVASRIESLKKDKMYLERDLQELQSKGARDLAEAAKKIAYYETEASKALSLAHSSHEKVTTLETQNAQTIMEIDNLQTDLDRIKTDYNKLDAKNKQLSDIIAQKDLVIKEKEKAVSDALKEVTEGKKTVELCEAEFIKMKTQYTQLELDFNDAKDRVKELEKQQKKLLGDVESYKKIEKGLREDHQKAKEVTDKTKQELRHFYQNQVEVVVRDKLKEFQEQLEVAEKTMQEEIKNRELTVAKTAAQHIQNLEEKHTIEVQLLEEKHLEEIRLYSVKLGHANQKIDSLESKLQEQSHRRDKIAHQLHKIMEVQWREAMKLINSKTPSSPDVYNDQLNQLKSKSYSNLEELLSGKQSPVYDKREPKELQMQTMDVTPVSTKPRNRQQIESELQKYVQMLLPKSTSAPDTNHNKGLQQTNDKSSCWHQELVQDEYNKAGKCGASKRLMKPPWK